MQSTSQRDLTIVGDFFRYSCLLFVPFCGLGLVYGLLKGFSLMAVVVNPLIYSIGISLIVIVISYDINTLLGLVGLGKNAQPGLHVIYHTEIQEISMLMGMTDYASALKKVDMLLRREPNFAMAHNLRGEILLEGYQRHRQARDCFNRAAALSEPEDEQYRLAKSLKASTYGS